MLRIRLSRTGKKRQPSYRVVVAERESKRDGRIVERIGHYNPLPDPIEFKIDEARALHWLSVGAQPSDAVLVLLKKQGTLDRLERLRAGEELDTLVSEFTGTEPAAEKADGGVVAAVVAPVAAAVEAVKDVAEAAADKIEEAIEAVLDEDEEE